MNRRGGPGRRTTLVSTALLAAGALAGARPGAALTSVDLAGLRAAAPQVAPAGRLDTVPLIHGTVAGVFRGTRTPLPFAFVNVEAVGFRRTLQADSLGRYVIQGVPPGNALIEVRHPGHDPLRVEVTVPAEGAVRLDLELTARPVELDSLGVHPRAGRALPDPSGAPSRAVAEVEVSALEAGVGAGMAALATAVRAVPGNDPPDPTDVLLMRGSTTDMRLVLLDGAPVYTPFHVAGLLTPFEPWAFSAALLHSGGAPGRYDGGLTSILDLVTRSPARDRVRASGSADLLAATLGLEFPVGPSAGVLGAARALHNLGDGPLGGASPYGYADALVRAEVDAGEGHRLRASAFANRESVALAADAPNGGSPGRPSEAWWSTRAASLAYEADLGTAVLEATAAGSLYRAQLPFLPGANSADPEPDALLGAATRRRGRVVAEMRTGSARDGLTVGVSAETQDARYRARALEGDDATAPRLVRGRGDRVGTWLDVRRSFSPTVSLRAGGRLDHFPGRRGAFRWAPRAALTWLLAPRAVLTVTAGRYHQYAWDPGQEVERPLAELTGTPDTEAPDEGLPLATADHVVLSLDQSLGADTRVEVQGFWKSYEGLGGDPPRLGSSGLDLRIHREGDDGTAWLGYNLSWYWAREGGYATERFSARHLLSAGLAGRLMGPLAASARISYGAGLPYTALPFSAAEEDLASSPDAGVAPTEAPSPLALGVEDDFLRVDLEVQAELRVAGLGRRWHLRPYLRVLNALRERDALFYTFQPWRDPALRPLARRPFLPIVGLSWSF